MTYSFIRPKLKPVLSLFAKIWTLFFLSAFIFIVVAYFFLLTRYLLSESELRQKKEAVVQMNEQSRQAEELYAILNERKNIALSIVGKEGSNELAFKQILSNLFGIVIGSGSIKLNELRMDASNLRITGITPTKEMFILLIQTPLQSTFDVSNTSFYPLKNGWFGFVSTNKKLAGGK